MTQVNPQAVPDLIRAERHAALRRLAASLSHALGTPLNVISGRAELIELDAEELPDILDSAQTIRRQALRISDMLKQVLAQLDELDEQSETYDFGALLTSIRSELPSAQLKVAPAVEARGLRRGERAQAFLLQLIRWAQDVGALEELEMASSKLGIEFRLRLRPLDVSDIRTALEPWIHREQTETRQGALTLRPAEAVQLAVALGHARDAGAELELRHALDHSLLVAAWPALG
ncbi:MAG: histidine kinase dimerization/phospho-acceptor domain-containing protein [Polyangiaceae bacterium]